MSSLGGEGIAQLHTNDMKLMVQIFTYERAAYKNSTNLTIDFN
jgi:hypothetical protein